MWLRRPLEGEEELLLAAALETVYLLELSHILQVGLELPVKRATPFGPNMEQKEYSFWSQNRAKGVVNIHFCQFGNSFLGKRSTPFGLKIEQKE